MIDRSPWPIFMEILMQAGFTFSTRSDRDKFEQDMYNLKMSFVDIIRSSSPVIESGGIHNGDTYSISLFWNEDDDVDLEELHDSAFTFNGTIAIAST